MLTLAVASSSAIGAEQRIPAASQESVAQRRPAEAQSSTLVPPVRPFHIPSRTGIEGQMELSLQQALSMALANNKDIESSRIDKQESDYNLEAALGAFDPRMDINNYWEQQITPIASTLGGSASGAVLNKTWLTDPAVTQPIPWYGGSVKTDLSSANSYSNNTFLSLNPQYPASLNFSYTQPLWRNLMYDSNRHQIDVAKKNRFLSDEQFRQRVMSVVAQTEQAYWELAYSYNNLQVQLEAVRIGVQQDESNRRQEQQGLLAPIDVVAAQTQLANFEVVAYTAQSALTSAENSLKALILPDRGDPLWHEALTPVTLPDVKAPIIPLDDAIAEALANRPELAQVKLSAEINEKDVRYYRDQTKPEVDLTALYTRAGLAGILIPAGPNPFLAGFGPLTNQVNELSALAGLPALPPVSFGTATLPPRLVGGYGQSLSNIWAGSFPTTEIQLRVSLPLRNRTAEANLSKSVAETRRIRNQRQQVEETIESGVRDTIENMQMAQLRLQAAQVARQSAEEQYQSEQRQFQAGTSTLFLVQQRQATMIAARSQERRSEADMSEAISAYRLATGSILTERNIQLR